VKRRAALWIAVLAWTLGCGPDAPPEEPAEAPRAAAEARAPASSEPPPQSEPSPVAAAVAPGSEARPAAGPLELSPSGGPPGSLLRVPESAASTRGPSESLAGPATPPPLAPDAPPVWKERVRVQRHSEAIGPAGPRQGTWSETDAALRVPVNERVQIEGGVRVGERDEPGREEQHERESTSRVGVEVRF